MCVIAADPPTSSSPTMSPKITNDREQRKQSLEVARTVLEQAVDLLQTRLTHDEQLSVSAKHVAGSTIGEYAHPPISGFRELI
jgi:hypothetical protein